MTKSHKGVPFNRDKHRHYDGVVSTSRAVVKLSRDVMYHSQGLDNVAVVLRSHGKSRCFKIVSYEENMYKTNKIA